jgi:predicted PurR-regulated permease PerM
MIRYEMAYRVWEADPTWQPILTSSFPEPSQLVGTVLGENGELLLPAALNLTQSLVAIFSNLFILLTFSLYWAQDQNHFERLWLSFLPPNRRIPARSAWRAVEQAVGGYLRQELALGLVAALLLGAGYALLGLPYPVTLALLAFMGWFIPLLGFVIILIPVFISTIELGWGMVFLASAFTLLILLGLKYWIEPKYLHSRRYSSFLIVFWTVVLGSFLGPGGFLAGPAVAAAAQAIGEQYLPYWLKPEPVEIQLAALEQRYTTAFQRFREVEAESPSPELGNIFSRLDHSLQRAEELVESPYAESQAQ